MSPLLRFLHLFILVFVPVASIIAQAPPRITFNKIGSKEGLSQGHGMAILQDSDGFMWFGTKDGLNKWDGYSMKVYRNNPKDSTSISSNDITALYEDDQQKLWIGTSNGLNVFDKKSEHFKSFKHNAADTKSISSGNVRSVYKDKNGNFWVGTYQDGLNLFDGNKFFTRIPTDETGATTFSCFYEDKAGHLWIGTGNGLREYNYQTKKFIAYNNISGSYVSSIYEDHLGNLWVATLGGGLNLFDNKTKNFKHFVNDPGNPASISNNNLYCVVEDPLGDLWIGSENGGLNLFDRTNNTFYRYTNDKYDASSLSSNTVSSLYLDKSGIIWVGMHRGGINFFSRKAEKFKHFKSESYVNSLSNNNIKPILQDRNGNIWIGTDGGGLNKFDPVKNTFERFNHDLKNPTSLGSDAVLALAEDNDGRIWIGTWDGGLNVLEPGSKTFKHFYNDLKDSTSVSSNNIWSLYKDKKGNIWVGTYGYGLCLFDKLNNTFTRISSTDKGKTIFPNNDIFSISEDNSGNIWVGTQSGLNKYNPQSKKVTTFLTDDKISTSISSNYINTIFTDSKGRIWIGSQKGLNLYNPDDNSFKLVGDKEGLGITSIQGILEDSNGNFWISTLSGLSKFNPDTKAFKLYTASDGLQGNEFSQNSAVKLKNGDMVFGGLNGINIFNPDSLKNNPFIPPVVFTSLQIFNKAVEIGEKHSPLKQHIGFTQELVLSYKQSVFSFEFAALNYLSSQNNQFAYKLEGFEKNWNYVGNERKATYTNIDPGEYIFKVKASNNDGVWNEEGTSIRIIITPPFWKTWWFKTLVAAFVIGGAVSFYKMRMRAIKAQKAELEKQVIERTAEVVQQKEELQAQAENLRATNLELHEKQEEILQQTEEILQQRELLEAQRDNLEIINTKVMSSITYAKTIQKAFLPADSKIKKNVQEHFVIYRPKDIVSGDFYWFSNIAKEELPEQFASDVSFFATIDCTGHGVPGAFMSIIGNTLLNEIVNIKRILDPAEILEQLDKGVKKAVDKSEGVNTAGMDVCLIRVEKMADQHVKILFAGAKRPLHYIQNDSGVVETLEGDRRSIGSDSKVPKPFTTQQLTVASGVMLYLTSDGFTDQNNPERQKFGSLRLKTLLKETFRNPLSLQKTILENALDQHQQNAEQRDDISFLGIKI